MPCAQLIGFHVDTIFAGGLLESGVEPTSLWDHPLAHAEAAAHAAMCAAAAYGSAAPKLSTKLLTGLKNASTGGQRACVDRISRHMHPSCPAGTTMRATTHSSRTSSHVDPACSVREHVNEQKRTAFALHTCPACLEWVEASSSVKSSACRDFPVLSKKSFDDILVTRSHRDLVYT